MSSREEKNKIWLTYFAQYMEKKFPKFLKDRAWNYKDDICLVGASKLLDVTKEGRWRRYIIDNAHWLMGEDGSLANWVEGENNIDKISFGKSLWILWNLTGDARYRDAIGRIYQALKTYPRTETGNFWHKDIYPNQVWLDGLYMVMPFYAKILVELQSMVEIREYAKTSLAPFYRKTLAEAREEKWNDIIDQFETAHELLWDGEKCLYVHGCDVSRRADWADKISGKSESVWLRAEGWYLMALADVYELAKDVTERADELKKLLRDGVDGILKYQDKKTKMFYQVVDKAEFFGNYLETSGSAMIAYTLMKGARVGALDEAYKEMGYGVLDGIYDNYLKKGEDGYHLYGICASAGLGDGPDPHNKKERSGKPEYYISEATMVDNQHGAAACMMAVSEQMRDFNRV